MDTKNTGCALELEFAVECIRRGAIVSQPIGDNAPYDFIVDFGMKIYKVQIKSTSSNITNTCRNVPQVNGPSSVAVKYNEKEIDIIATKNNGVWFLFSDPHLLPTRIRINLEGSSKQKYMYVREAWHIIFGETEKK